MKLVSAAARSNSRLLIIYSEVNLHLLLAELGRRRPVFHSEADFQHALAWVAQEMEPDARIRLEVPLYGLQGRGALDITIRDGRGTTALELKYCKARLSADHEGEKFELPGTVARDLFRHDVCKDIWRLEHAIGSGQADRGFCVVLTNDRGIWSDSGFQGIDQQFKIHDGRHVAGSLSWSDRAGGTAKGRENPICLAGSYALEWRDYSEVPVKNGRFRVLVVEVTSWSKIEPTRQADGVSSDVGEYQATPDRGSTKTRFELLRLAIMARGHDSAFTLTEIESIVGDLPPSARSHNAWWSHVGSHPHAVWEHDGYRASPQLARGMVRFVKKH